MKVFLCFLSKLHISLEKSDGTQNQKILKQRRQKSNGKRMKKIPIKNHLLALVAIMVIVLITLSLSKNYLLFDKKDAFHPKNGNWMKPTLRLVFCGDKTCLDGSHVSCYFNETKDCICEHCFVYSKSKEETKIFNHMDASLINSDTFNKKCVGDAMHSRGAPNINIFLMDFLADIDDKTMQTIAPLLEAAFCNATNGEIVLNITTKKYNWTQTNYPLNFINYQPFQAPQYELT